MQLQPLDEADFDRLEELLETDVFAGDAYGLDEIQAMLCAVVSGPTPVMPSVWLPEILGEPGLGAADDPRVQETIGLLMRLNNDIAAALLAGQGIAPIVYPLDEEGNAYDYATWADAYVFGTSLGEDWFDHVGKQGAKVRLVHAELLLHGQRGQADLAAHDAAALGLGVAHIGQLDGIGVLGIADFVAQRGNGGGSGFGVAQPTGPEFDGFNVGHGVSC